MLAVPANVTGQDEIQGATFPPSGTSESIETIETSVAEQPLPRIVPANPWPAKNGIWTSADELRKRPMIGPGWNAVVKAALQPTNRPDIGDADDRTNVRVLAAAIVFARTGDDRFHTKVVETIKLVVAQGEPGGRTLAWGRNVGAYVLAADLLPYRSPEFDGWLRNVSEVWKGADGRTLRETFEQRPNNWGFHAFGSLCAIYRYLGDEQALREIRAHWVEGVTGSNPAHRFGRDRTWHVDSDRPLTINPKGAVKQGMIVDGLFPDEMRRGGPFQNPPIHTRYAWEAQQGLVMAARILERAGMPIWDAGDQALYRAAFALQQRLGGRWRARGDDRWMLAFYDDAYGTNWSRHQDVWGHGKNTGWAYILDFGTRQPAAPLPP